MIQPEWITAKEYEDITYKKSNGVARIAFNRPNIRNAFRPKTTSELYDAFYDAEEYHQDFEKKNPYQPYILSVSKPKIEKVAKRFKHLLKEGEG